MKSFKILIIRIILRLHNVLEKIISKIVVKYNNGIHPKHEITKYHRFFVDNINKNSKVLDVGCGIGVVSYHLAKKANLVYAIDINKKSIEYAKKMNYRENIHYINADIFNYNSEEKFDYIVLSNVLEHIKERKRLLSKLQLLSKIILVRVPLIDRSWLPIYKKKMGVEFRLDSTHEIEYTFNSFKQEIESAGFIIEEYSIQFGEIWAIVKSLK